MPEGTAALAAETNEPSFVETVTEEGQQQTQTEEGAGGAPATTQKPDELKTALTELAKTVGGMARDRQTQPQEKQLSEEEKAELWAVYNPTKSNPDFFRKWLRLNTDMDPAEVEKAIKEYQPLFAEMQTGLVRQSVVGARNIMNIELARLREEFGPIVDYVSSAKAEKTREKFYGEYPALREENEAGVNKYGDVIDAVARTLADQTFDSEAHYFKVLAESTAKAIKGLVPEFDLGKKPEKKPAVTSPRLPRTSVGGTGGTAAGGKKPAEKGKGDDDSDSLDWGNYGKT